MAAHLQVQASVVDIRGDEPRSGDGFLVDTNVWYWMHYSRASEAFEPPQHYQVTEYPTYVRKALRARADLYRCGLTLGELAHVIERTEYEAYIRAAEEISFKEFRHDLPDVHANIAKEVEDAWGLISRMTTSLDVTIDPNTTSAILADFGSSCIDGVDLFLVQAMRGANITQILTDDADFVTVSDIIVFTANQTAITAATEQNRSLRRPRS